MKYHPGDIVLDFDQRIIFTWSKHDEQTARLKVHRMRLATPGEEFLYKKDFPVDKDVLFQEFKEVMPAFDGRRLRNVVYAHVELDEETFLFFKSFRLNFTASNEVKLSFLITSYLRSIEHNNKEALKELENGRKLKGLLVEILKLISV
ncbi:MAG: hypothetical protein NTX61_08350 [Bacteroidetes bacterium]|nr:hypothetical protein [Bacteroidota bacterium]